ncbi:MAG TPA: transglutaminase family protein [Kiritimatiellia bacterium]|nr:transglutaminase family protein [Kiritimatiellia bacterium]
MLFQIRHTTSYTYSRPVALDPHTLRVRPRNDGSQTLRNFTLEISPRPAGMTEFTDLEGNAAAQIWFNEMTDKLTILIISEVETLRENPYEFVLADPGVMTLPVRYQDPARMNLRPYCQPVQHDGPVAWYAEEIARATGYDTLRFLSALTQDLYERIAVKVRLTGEPQTAAETLKSEEGAGRDIAVLFMEACRTQGIAARFASGYWNGHAPDGNQYLHAWAEVYFPQCGWRGYDPSTGLAVADQHVPVSSGLYPGSAASITGAFWGSDVNSVMETSVDIHAG